MSAWQPQEPPSPSAAATHAWQRRSVCSTFCNPGGAGTRESWWCGASHAHHAPRPPRRRECSTLRITARLMGDEEMDTSRCVTLPNDAASSHCQPARLGGLEAFVEPRERRRRATEAETGCSDAARFELELEFVQCLANPKYLNCAHCSAHTLHLPAAPIAQVVEHAKNPFPSASTRTGRIRHLHDVSHANHHMRDRHFTHVTRCLRGPMRRRLMSSELVAVAEQG